MDKTIDFDRYEAALFDLDGVLTSTAKLHAICWKQMFDQYLQQKSFDTGVAFHPFDIDRDYRLYVDGTLAESFNLPSKPNPTPLTGKSSWKPRPGNGC